jgi:hypothetical protein
MKSTSRRDRRAASALTLLALVAALLSTLVTTGSSASARPAARKAGVERLHRLGRAPFEESALVRTTQGVAIAAWPTGSRADGARDDLVVALRRPHHGWTAPHRIGATPGVSAPVLAPLSRGRAVVAWTTMTGTVATRIWLPKSGWEATHELSGRTPSQVPLLASDVFAATWAVGRVVLGPDPQQPHLVLEVHRGSTVRDVTLADDAPCFPDPGSLAVDDSGVIAASWSYFCPSGLVQRWAATVPADGTPPVVEQLPACGENACDRGLHILRTPTGFVGFGTVNTQSGFTTGTWSVDQAGHWTMEQATHGFIRRTPAISPRGLLVSCISHNHRRIHVRPPGGTWRPIGIPAMRVEACAVDSRGRVVLLGTRDVRHHPLVLVWGNNHTASLTHAARIKPLQRHYGRVPQLVVSDRGLVTGLITTDDGTGRPQLGLAAVRAQL